MLLNRASAGPVAGALPCMLCGSTAHTVNDLRKAEAYTTISGQRYYLDQFVFGPSGEALQTLANFCKVPKTGTSIRFQTLVMDVSVLCQVDSNHLCLSGAYWHN